MIYESNLHSGSAPSQYALQSSSMRADSCFDPVNEVLKSRDATWERKRIAHRLESVSVLCPSFMQALRRVNMRQADYGGDLADHGCNP